MLALGKVGEAGNSACCGAFPRVRTKSEDGGEEKGERGGKGEGGNHVVVEEVGDEFPLGALAEIVLASARPKEFDGEMRGSRYPQCALPPWGWA